MKKQVKFLTVTLAIETDCDDMDAIEAAVCSSLADMSIDYDCEEDAPDGEGTVRVVVEGRVAIAKTDQCRVDAGVSAEYAHPDAHKGVMQIGGTQFVCG